MRTIAKPILLLVLAVMLSACGDFLDANDNPNAATEPPPDNLLPSAIVRYAQNQESEIGWQHAYHAQSWAPYLALRSADRYQIGASALNNTWNAFFLDGNGIRIVQEVSADEGNLYASAQARLFLQFLLLEGTTTFGSIPYTQAFQVEQFPEPEFDDQQVILEGILENCDTALNQLKAAEGGSAITNGDLIYQGDTDQWIKFANALKLKAGLLLQGGDPTSSIASSALDEVLGASDAQKLRTNADNAEVAYDGGTQRSSNPRYQVHVLNSLFDDDDESLIWAAGSAIVNEMNELDDPRRDVYFTELDGESPNTDDAYEGREPGNFSGDTVTPSADVFFAEDKSSRLFTAAEMLLMEAEVHLARSEREQAHDKYIEGVQASLDYFDFAGFDLTVSDADKQAYIASLPDEASLTASDIHIQQYIDLYERGSAIWTQQRRTGVPELELPDAAIVPGILSRWPYPDFVQVQNPNTPQQPVLSEPQFFQGG